MSTELTTYAFDSLEERMITRILEREDEGFIRWEPRAIYEQVAARNPDLYPESPPRGLLKHYTSPEFAEELAVRRSHRYMNRLPAAMLHDTIGRRMIDLLIPIVFDGLSEGRDAISMPEARKMLKDALAYVAKNEEALRPPPSQGKIKDDDTDLTFQEALKLIGVAQGDEKEAIAKFLVMQLLSAAELAAAEEAEVIEDDGV